MRQSARLSGKFTLNTASFNYPAVVKLNSQKQESNENKYIF